MAIDEFGAFEEMKRSGLASEVLEALVSPFDAAEMSIWRAIGFEAREGGRLDFDVSDHARWRAAVEVVRKRIHSGAYQVVGQRSASDLPEILPAHLFRDIHFVHPFQAENDPNNQAFNERPFVDLGGHDGDRVYAGETRPIFINLRIRCADVIEHSRFEISPGLYQMPAPAGELKLQGFPIPPGQSPVGPSTTPDPSVGPDKKKHHKSAPERLRVIETIRSELANGSLTLKALHRMMEKELEGKYHASRDTCRRARHSVLVVRAIEGDLASSALTINDLKQMAVNSLVERYGLPKDRRPDESCAEARDILLAEL